MATLNSATSPEAAAPQVRPVIFQAFQWPTSAKCGTPITLDSGSLASFTGAVRDVCSGVRRVMQIIEMDATTEDSEIDGRPIPALLSTAHKFDLLRLCLHSLEHLEVQSEKMTEALDKRIAG